MQASPRSTSFFRRGVALASSLAVASALLLPSSAHAIRRGDTSDVAQSTEALTPGIQRKGALLHGITLAYSTPPVPVLVSVDGSSVPMTGSASLEGTNRVVIRLTHWGDKAVTGRVLEQNSKMEGLAPVCTKSAIAFRYKCLVAQLPKGTQVVTVLQPAGTGARRPSASL